MKIKELGTPYDFQTSPIIHVLKNRGIVENQLLKDFINNDLDKYENSPNLLDNVEEGINCLEYHINTDSNIYLIIDCDVDGYTSAAIMVLYIRERYNYNKIKFIMHDGKEHGIEMDKIPRDCQFLIIPDASSNDYDAHKILKDRGVDILILDHHEADKVSENAIVINNQLCNYPNKTLCGGGVVYKFCQAIDNRFGNNIADNYLDLVSLSLISDMMDMRNPETFCLIQKGLRKAIKNEFYQTLLDKQSYSIGAYVTPISIAFYITPLINACIRVGTNEEKAVVFKAFIDPFDELESTKRGHKPGDIEICKDQATRYAVNAKSKQTRLRDKGLEKIEAIIEDRDLLNNKILFIEINDELDKNITGLIANQLMSKYQRPVLLLRNVPKEGTLSGSGRSYDKSNLNNFREYLFNTGFFNFCQGHNSAFGASINKDKVDDFIKYSNEQLKDFNFEVTHDVDFVIDMNERADTLESILENINAYIHYWGKDMEEPMVHVKNLLLNEKNTALIGKGSNTLRIIENGVTFLKFNISDSEQKMFKKVVTQNETMVIDIVGRPNKNEWGGKVSQQLFINDYKVLDKSVVF